MLLHIFSPVFLMAPYGKWLTCHITHTFSSPPKSVFEDGSVKLATGSGTARCGLGPGGPTQPCSGKEQAGGRTEGAMFCCPVSCLFSSLQGLSLKGQNTPVSSGSSTTGCSYTNIRLQRDPSTVTPSSRPPPWSPAS